MFKKILKDLEPTSTKLIAVSKTKSNEAILEMYHQGQKMFGENRVQELVSKYEVLPKDINWHFIGHLQTNKVKYIAPFVDCIQAVDSLKLLQEINRHAKKNNRSISCLLQFHIAEEANKFGLLLPEARNLIQSPIFSNLNNIKLTGVMGMATFTDDVLQIRREFQQLKTIFDTLKDSFFEQDAYFKEISMGMSGDYQIAVEEGSTMVRIGSLIFGTR